MLGRCTGSTRTLPPPCVCGSIELGPISASRSTLPAGRGRTPRSFFSRTKERAPTSRSSAGSMRAECGDATWPAPLPSTAPLSAPTLRARPSSRATLWSISASGTRPARTAASSESPQGPFGPGMMRSRPPSALETVDVVADQSDTTTPLKPHSVLSRPSSRTGFAVIVAPLTELYAAMIMKTSASATHASNGAR